MKITVECKSPNPFLSRGLKRLAQIADSLKNAMELLKWPDHLRLEINIIGPFHGRLSSVCSKIITKAIETDKRREEEFSDETVHGIIVIKDSPFRMTDVNFAHDIMAVSPQTPTGLLNPKATFLRVTSSVIENRFSTHIGNCINGALKQLPETNDCIIFIEQAPFKSVKTACQRRLSDLTYSHVRAIGIIYTDEINFLYRENEKDFIKKMQLT